MTTIYYLQWDVSGPKHSREEASDLFHMFHVNPPTELTESAFDDLYEEVAEVEPTDLEEVFAAWNRGSGRESDRFRDLRYCERCQTYIEGSDEAITHAAQNHSYDALHDPGEPDYIRGERSMSVGDIVERDETYYACAPIGWQEVTVRDR